MSARGGNWRRHALLMAALVLPAGVASASGDSYAQMLGYLTSSHLSGQALAGAQGSLKVNLAAGDLNIQHNAHAVATGAQALAGVAPGQLHGDDHYPAPDQAEARIDGRVLAGGSGVASINQASGSGNAQLNAVASAAGGRAAVAWQHTPTPHAAPLREAARGLRRASVGASALQGFDGVLQINQIAGSANAVENRLGLLVQSGL